jgi:acid phosphatase class B
MNKYIRFFEASEYEKEMLKALDVIGHASYTERQGRVTADIHLTDKQIDGYVLYNLELDEDLEGIQAFLKSSNQEKQKKFVEVLLSQDPEDDEQWIVTHIASALLEMFPQYGDENIHSSGRLDTNIKQVRKDISEKMDIYFSGNALRVSIDLDDIGYFQD